MEETLNGDVRKATYTYDGDNRVSTYKKGTVSQNYTYDAFGRNKNKIVKDGDTTLLTTTNTFRTVSGNPTGQVATLKNQAANYNVTYTYTYDSNGNILTVSDGTYTTSYEYDESNQLVRENNQASGVTYIWTYDNAGNIVQRNVRAYSTDGLGEPYDSLVYSYGDSQWGDLLTFGENAHTYDEIGNTLSDGKRTYTWKHGRQLATLTQNGKTWTNSYNIDGLRTKRTDGTNTYQYTYSEGKLISMTYNSDKLYFSYTPDGLPYYTTYGGNYYIYALNLQGDVMAILNEAGQAVVEYTYDAWGNILSVTGSMASTLGQLNPLRYRGYVYDNETQLYYLQSRYYDPEIGRFINADTFTSTGQGLTGNNMFAYCGNNPVSREDDGGEFWHIVAGAAVGAGIGIASKIITNAMSGSNLTDGLLTAGLAGAVSGGLAASGVGLVGQIVGNAAIGMVNNATDQVIGISNNPTETFDVGSMLIDGAIGAVAGLAGGPGAGSKSLTKIGATNLKRTANALAHNGVKEAKQVLTKGLVYFEKNARHIVSPLAKSLAKAAGSSLFCQTAKILSFKERRLG